MRRKVLGISLLTLLLALLAGAAAFTFETLSLFDLDKIDALPRSSLILDEADREAAELSGAGKRRPVALEEMPEHLREAFIAAEDARFYRHRGVDPVRIGGALLSNIRSRDYGQGASTITQQLIKLTHLSSDKTLLRKAREAILAMRLETVLTKDEILTAYLNTVYFGGGAYGVEAAALYYFGISASRLSLSQSALLAGIVKAPSRYAPNADPEKAVERRNLVLRAMLEQGFITREEAEAARAEVPVIVAAADSAAFAYFIDAASAEAASLLNVGIDDFLCGGYRVYTTLSPAAQAAAEKLFRDPAAFPAAAADGEEPEAALAAADPRTGAILALVGGRDGLARRALNRAVGMRRQPGSAIKPVSVYAAAVDGFGFLPVSVIRDEKKEFAGGYSPANVEGKYLGAVTLREALSRSLNAAAVDLIAQTGPDAALSYARKLGLNLPEADKNLSLALGSLTYGVSPAELNAAYAPLANGGLRKTPHLIRKILSAEGEVLYEFRESGGRALSAVSACLLTDMLRTAARTGSARSLSALPFPVAGKTGTVGVRGGNRDLWTVAYTPAVSVTVWMGYDRPDDSHLLPDAESGSGKPCRLAAAFLRAVAERADAGEFPVPAGVSRAVIDVKSVGEGLTPLLAGAWTPRAYQAAELFPASKRPRRFSDLWRAPETPADLAAEREAGAVTLRFTALSADARYRVFREGSARPLTTLGGEAGEALSFVDELAPAGAEYYLVPLDATLLAEGRELAGERSPAARPVGVLRWGW